MPEYVPYLFTDELSKYDEAFHKLITSTNTDTNFSDEAIEMIKDICESLNDDDVARIMVLEQWSDDPDPQVWRDRVQEWSRRETLYVIACLRWECQQFWVMCMLNREHAEEEKKEMKKSKETKLPQPLPGQAPPQVSSTGCRTPS